MTGRLRIRSRRSHSTVGKFEKSVSHKLPHLLRLLCSTDLQATGEAAKVHSTSDRTYPSLTTTEGQEAQRAKFCKYVIQDQWTLTTRSLLLNVWTLNVVKWHSSKVFSQSDLIRVMFNFLTGRGTNILRSSKLCVTKDTESSPKLSILTLDSQSPLSACGDGVGVSRACLSLRPWYASKF